MTFHLPSGNNSFSSFCIIDSEAFSFLPELSVAFFLFRYRERDKNTDMVHFDSPFATKCNYGFIQEQKGIFNRSGIDKDTPDKSFGFDVGSKRRQACLRQTCEKQE